MDRLRTITGRLDYLDADGRSWGREVFSVSIHESGRTIRTLSELDTVDLLRDTNWSLSPDWLPREGFFRTIAKGITTAHSWFRIDGANIEYEGCTAALGRVSQRLTAPSPVEFLGFHAMAGDSMIGAARGCDHVGVERSIVCVTNSLSAYGDEGLTAQLARPRVTYLGRETISVRAGVFDTEHFEVRWSDVMPKRAHFWVLPEHYLPVRLTGALGSVTYELVEIDLD